ncbi:transcriptional regulator [Alicyclobacillus cellulosilyticus]|uniref:Transcriptional regulator n=1 Tax=Alicyclobacillus cellulosilyticus TaxID=1003997 RepID=A0A917K8W8_9BACL|nr:ROK family transcriptional regulator [Alicyclobacillus cellulosilyticus]GGJ02632.1 transcriptional regulator [Alicyclobacillus cellulosilyticus]
MRFVKETPAGIRQANRMSVLHLIKEYGPMSRARVARVLKMSRSTVSAIVDELIQEGRIREGANGQSTAQGGRPPQYLHYVPDAKFALGVDIGGTNTIVVLTDLAGHVVAREKFPTRAGDEHPLAAILERVKAFLARTGVAREKLLGTGIGFPGVTDTARGVVLNSPSLGLVDFDAVQFFDPLPGPVFIDNDVNMGVIGERWLGAAQGLQNVVLVAIGTGIGAGLILNGEVYRGAGGSAGEIGHLHVDPLLADRRRTLHEFGPLESAASGLGMEQVALTMRAAVEEHPRRMTAEELFAAAKAGDVIAQQVIGRAILFLSFSIANMITLLNPDLVLLGGGVAQAGSALLEPVRAHVARLSPVSCPIELAGLGEDSAALGAAATVFLAADELRWTGRKERAGLMRECEGGDGR